MCKRRVVDVLADVVLIQPHGRIRREREVLQEQHVETHRFGTGVLDAHVPEPGWRVGRKPQGHAVTKPLPIARAFELAGIGVDAPARRAARPEQPCGLEGRLCSLICSRKAPQDQVGRAAFERRADEQVNDNVAEGQTAQSAVVMAFDAQSGWAGPVRQLISPQAFAGFFGALLAASLAAAFAACFSARVGPCLPALCSLCSLCSFFAAGFSLACA